MYSERDGKPLEAPVKAGDEVGELTVSYNGTVYGTVKLVAAVDVAVSKGAYIVGHLRAFFTNPIVLVVLLLAIVLARHRLCAVAGAPPQADRGRA
ncbi:MAG: hypothetical protein ACLUNO_09705 [Oscillospiraceae bacterium]